MEFEYDKDEHGNTVLSVGIRGFGLLASPLLNKGMAFTKQEREEFNLLGLLPPYETNLETQLLRTYEAFHSKPSDIEKYIYLRDLQDSNETLFYKFLETHIEEAMPIVYTPTVGLGCQRYSHIYRRPRGIYISYPDKHLMDKIFKKNRFDRVSTIVVSDGERILGLGDQGAGGMGIPIGKLALYSACAGIHPVSTLPILLDTGTNNTELINDPLYIGWHHERVRGKEYDDFIDTFVKAVKKRFPHVLLQWEDFAQQNALPILERYRNELCTFNDDIQGTAAVAAGTLFAAIHVTKSKLKDQRIVIVGAGSAGIGISNLLVRAMLEEGLTEKEARERFYLIDQPGLLLDEFQQLQDFQRPFARSRNHISHWKLTNPNTISLYDVIAQLHPTILIGVSGQPDIFDEKIVREMAKHVERPIIFPLSNPTIRCEATPNDIMAWTNERAIISTGSPFAAITRHGKKFRVDQTNNCYIFPGVGLGLTAVKARQVTDDMFMRAAKALASLSPAKQNPDANLLPPLTQIRDVSLQVAIAVAEEVIASGESKLTSPPNHLEQHIKQFMWKPEYLRYVLHKNLR